MTQPMQGDPDYVTAHENHRPLWTLECYSCASVRDWTVTIVFSPSEHPQISLAKNLVIRCGCCGGIEEIELEPKKNFFVEEAE